MRVQYAEAGETLSAANLEKLICGTMKLHQIIFSPTGGTKRVSECLAAGVGMGSVVTDLCVKAGNVHQPPLAEGDLAIIAMPVYGGRIPALAIERLKQLESNHAQCVIVAVYGNRAYDDALAEMQDVATELGFRVIAAVAAIAEHSIARMYAGGRPDEVDSKELDVFGKAIMEKVAAGDTIALTLPGNRPYKQAGTGPFPEANDNCKDCGTCAELCPAGAISIDNLRVTDKGLCIGCMRCVTVCPQHAREIGKALPYLEERLRPLCSDRKGNELFL